MFSFHLSDWSKVLLKNNEQFIMPVVLTSFDIIEPSLILKQQALLIWRPQFVHFFTTETIR